MMQLRAAKNTSAITRIFPQSQRSFIYPGGQAEVISTHTEQSAELTISIAGGDLILYARRGKSALAVEPNRVEAVGTVGAGDNGKSAVLRAALGRQYLVFDSSPSRMEPRLAIFCLGASGPAI
jgi:hypothetical protein